MAEANRDVRIIEWPDSAAKVAHHFEGDKPLPVCLKVCEPICANSDYVIGLEIFDRPFATITVKGQTVIHNCREKL